MNHLLREIDFTDPLSGVDENSRVGATEAALDLLGEIRAHHGPVILHQSGGCVGRSELLCLPMGELELAQHDVRIGEVDGAPVYIRAQHVEDWETFQMVLDVVRGHGGAFSLDAGMGRRFIVRCRKFSDAQRNALGLATNTAR
ncbi:MAG: DUF779 domain-containing protein [Pseudomonadota bacterium]